MRKISNGFHYAIIQLQNKMIQKPLGTTFSIKISLHHARCSYKLFTSMRLEEKCLFYSVTGFEELGDHDY